MLRSAPTANPSTDVERAPPERPRDVESREEIAARHREERAAKQAREAAAAQADASAAHALTIHVLVREKGDPVAGARVVVEGDYPERHEATTDAAGDARIENVASDYLRVATTAAGFTRGRAFVTKDDRAAGAPIEVKVGPAVSIDGFVRDATDGRGLVGAKIEASEGNEVVADATTAADGSFHLDGLPVPAPSVQSVAPSVTATAPRHLRETLDVEGATRLEFRLRPAGALRGRVFDPDGKPAPWAKVTATLECANKIGAVGRATLETTTGEDGTYELDELQLDRTWRVVASKPGCADSLPADDVVVDAATHDVVRDFALRTAARVVVRVLRPDGASVGAGARVRLVSPVGQSTEKTTDESGSCAFDQMTEGACAIGVEARGFAPTTANADVALGARRECVVTLVAGADLAGVVIDDVGAPIAHASLVARCGRFERAAPWPHETTSDDDGTFRFEALAPGEVSLDASVAGHAAVFAVRAFAPAADARIVLPRDGGVAFRLRAPGGAKVPSACNVTAWPKAAEHENVLHIHTYSVDSSGIDVRLPLRAGTWTVTIAARDYLPVTREIDVAPAADTQLGELVLDPGLALDGRVVDSAGRPIVGAFVFPEGANVLRDLHFTPNNTRFFYGAAQQIGRSGVGGLPISDAAGAFRLEHQPPGARTLSVHAEGFVVETAEYDLQPGAAPLVVTLHHGGLVRGVVKDADGLPAVDVAVVVVRGDSKSADAESMRIARDGAFSLRLREGRARVVVRRGDDELASRDVEIREDGETVVDFTLPR